MSTKFFLVGLLLFIGVVLVLCVIVRHLRSELRMVKCQLEATEKAKNAYAEQAARLSGTLDVQNKNRKEADEKIDDLHTGDAVDNALGGLSKRKN